MTRRLPEGIRRLYRPGDKPGKPTGRYQARYTVVRGGKKVQVSAGTFATLADARDARSLELAKLKNGGWVDPLGPKTLLSRWADEWLELNNGGNSKTQSFLRSRIVPWWGDRPLGDITPMDVQKWVNLLVGDGLSPATIRAIFYTFKRIMADAVEHDLLAKNPCRRITLPAEKRHDPTPLSVEQLVALQEAAPAPYAAMVHLGAWAGLRWQECAGLTWDAVDLENGLLRVVQAVKSTGELGTTKNGKERVVPIGQSTVDVLRAHRRDFGSRELLFVNQRGTRLVYSNFRKAVWVPLVEKVGLDPAPTWHDLRHAHVAHMRRVGMDPDILSQRLGHHKPSFTADRYGWTRADHREVSVAAIEAAMRGE